MRGCHDDFILEAKSSEAQRWIMMNTTSLINLEIWFGVELLSLPHPFSRLTSICGHILAWASVFIHFFPFQLPFTCNFYRYIHTHKIHPIRILYMLVCTHKLALHLHAHISQLSWYHPLCLVHHGSVYFNFDLSKSIFINVALWLPNTMHVLRV